MKKNIIDLNQVETNIVDGGNKAMDIANSVWDVTKTVVSNMSLSQMIGSTIGLVLDIGGIIPISICKCCCKRGHCHCRFGVFGTMTLAGYAVGTIVDETKKALKN